MKREGVLRTIVFAFKRMGFIFCRREMLFYRLDLNQFQDDSKGSYSFRIATPEELQRRRDHYKGWDGWLGYDAILRRVQEGHLLFLVEDGDKIVFSQWAEIREGALNWLDIHMSLPQNTAYTTFIHTAPEYRGKGIAYRTNREIFSYLKEQGFSRVVLAIDPSNTASVRLNTKLGFVNYQAVRYRRYAFVKCYRIRECGGAQRTRTCMGLFKTPAGIWDQFLEQTTCT